MKVVAGSCGNDAIGPLALIRGGVMVWPEERGPRKAGLIHIACDVLVSNGRWRVAERPMRNASRVGIVA
jgi:hypothetical protein